jgi:predicted RNA-binding protein YlxR (DUF448 family)
VRADGVDSTMVTRTCIGCRSRDDVTALVRLVAAPGETATVVVPDPRRSMPGRGAHLHPDPRCLEQARRRRAFGRALRVEGPLDLTLLDDVATPPA